MKEENNLTDTAKKQDQQSVINSESPTEKRKKRNIVGDKSKFKNTSNVWTSASMH